MTTTPVDDEVIDSAAIRAFTEESGDRATRMPPLAIVIAAFNEEGAIGPVVEALPAIVTGLAAVKIVVSDGSVDSTGKEAREAGALVCDVPVNRGQGAALRLGYRLAREGQAVELAPRHYHSARLHNGVVRSPLLGGADLVVLRTRFYDFDR